MNNNYRKFYFSSHVYEPYSEALDNDKNFPFHLSLFYLIIVYHFVKLLSIIVLCYNHILINTTVYQYVIIFTFNQQNYQQTAVLFICHYWWQYLMIRIKIHLFCGLAFHSLLVALTDENHLNTMNKLSF